MELNDKVRELFEGKNLANLATVGGDGYPQVTPVWVDYDGRHILVNTAQGRAKVRNIRNNPKVAFSIYAPNSAYAPAFVWGQVVEITTDGADQHIDKMAQKYLGEERYPFASPGEQRVLLKIEVDKVRF